MHNPPYGKLFRNGLRSLLILLGFTVWQPLWAQLEVSKAQLWSHIETAYENDSLALVMELTEQYLEEIPQLDSAEIIAAVRYQGRVHRTQGDYVKSIDEYKQVYDYAKVRRDSLLQAQAADQIGIMNTFMGNMQEGQKYLLETAELYARVGTLQDQADANNGLAIFYNDVGQLDKAVKVFDKALAQYVTLDDTLGRANVHANLGLLYMYENQYELAEENILMQGYLDTLLQTQWGLGFHYDFMGSLRRRQGRLEEALHWKELGLAVREQLPSHYNLAESRSGLAYTYIELGRFEEAIEQAQLILDYREQHESLIQQMAAYAHLSDAYKGLGQLDKALEYYGEYKVMSDSIYQRDMLAEIANKDALYRKAVQDEEIARLDADNQVQAEKLRNKNWVIGISTVALLIFLVLATMLYRLYQRVSTQKNQLARALSDKELLLKEIHHRVKNNLQMVSSLLNLQSRHLTDTAAVDALQLGKSRVRSMAMIHQQLYTGREVSTLVGTREYLEKLTRELVTTYASADTDIALDLRVTEAQLDIDTLIPLGLIVNEAVTNAVKYAYLERNTGQLRVQLQAIASNVYKLLVADDGPGVQPVKDDKNLRFGSMLMETLAEQLDGTLERESSAEGTEVRLVFHAG